MFKRLFNLTICLVMALGSLSVAGGDQIVKAEGEENYLVGKVGISAYFEVDLASEIDLSTIVSKCQPQILTEKYLLCSMPILGYAEIYEPYVLVVNSFIDHDVDLSTPDEYDKSYFIAFYLNSDPAAKMIDIINKNLSNSLLVQALDKVWDISGVEINYFNFNYPDATDMLLIAEEKAPDDSDNYFKLTLPVGTYPEHSYAFYQNYYPKFTLNTTNFVLTNAVYAGSPTTGSIYGLLTETTTPMLLPEVENTFTVDSYNVTGVQGFGALLLTYNDILAELNYSEQDDAIFISLISNSSFDAIFPTIATLPGDFLKGEEFNLDIDRTLNWTLEWEDSTAPNYEYCVTDQVDELSAPICNNWVSAGSQTSVNISVPLFNQTYYWQVRASNDFGIVYADSGAWREFTTGNPVAPDPFVKVSPASGADISPTAVELDWAPSPYGAYSYEYCVSTDFDTNCTSDSANWINVGLQTSVKLDVEFGEEYEWQVRAVNPGFTTDADDDNDENTDDYWTFTTTSDLNKSKPVDGATVNSKVDLIWQKLGASKYEYCLTTTKTLVGIACDTGWVEAGTAITVPVSGLKMNKTYYWQVRATNVAATTIYANSGNWWSFKVKTPTTGIGFVKEAPEDGSTDQPISGLTLDWSAASRAKSYEYCIYKVGGTCSYISVGADTFVVLDGLNYSTPYNWQVRAKVANSYVFADDGLEWTFTTIGETITP